MDFREWMLRRPVAYAIVINRRIIKDFGSVRKWTCHKGKRRRQKLEVLKADARKVRRLAIRRRGAQEKSQLRNEIMQSAFSLVE